MLEQMVLLVSLIVHESESREVQSQKPWARGSILTPKTEAVVHRKTVDMRVQGHLLVHLKGEKKKEELLCLYKPLTQPCCLEP